MTIQMRLLVSLVVFSQCMSSVHADEETDASPAIGLNDAFAIQGDVVLTQAELDAEFSKIPAEHRLAFIRNGERVNQLVGTMLRYKIVAADARAAGFDDDVLVKARPASVKGAYVKSMYLSATQTPSVARNIPVGPDCAKFSPAETGAGPRTSRRTRWLREAPLLRLRSSRAASRR